MSVPDVEAQISADEALARRLQVRLFRGWPSFLQAEEGGGGAEARGDTRGTK